MKCELLFASLTLIFLAVIPQVTLAQEANACPGEVGQEKYERCVIEQFGQLFGKAEQQLDQKIASSSTHFDEKSTFKDLENAIKRLENERAHPQTGEISRPKNTELPAPVLKIQGSLDSLIQYHCDPQRSASDRLPQREKVMRTLDELEDEIDRRFSAFQRWSFAKNISRGLANAIQPVESAHKALEAHKRSCSLLEELPVKSEVEEYLTKTQKLAKAIRMREEKILNQKDLPIETKLELVGEYIAITKGLDTYFRKFNSLRYKVITRTFLNTRYDNFCGPNLRILENKFNSLQSNELETLSQVDFSRDEKAFRVITDVIRDKKTKLLQCFAIAEAELEREQREGDNSLLGDARNNNDGLDPNTPLNREKTAKAHRCNAANEIYKKALTASKAGDVKSYRSNLQRARNKILNPNDAASECPNLVADIAGGFKKASLLSSVDKAFSDTMQTCALPKMIALKKLLSKTTHPSISLKRQALDQAIQAVRSLRETEVAISSSSSSAAQNLEKTKEHFAGLLPQYCSGLKASLDNLDSRLAQSKSLNHNLDAHKKVALKNCQTIHGPSVEARYNASNSSGSFSCECVVGTSMQGSKICRSDQEHASLPPVTLSPLIENTKQTTTQTKREATHNRRCETGYRVGLVNADGTYYCKPSKHTANARCNQLNKGSGWYAVNIKSNGEFVCQRNTTRADHVRACRKTYGKRLVGVSKQGRNWVCNHCPRGTYASKGLCYNVQRAKEPPKRNYNNSPQQRACKPGFRRNLTGCVRICPPGSYAVGGGCRRLGSAKS